MPFLQDSFLPKKVEATVAPHSEDVKDTCVQIRKEYRERLKMEARMKKKIEAAKRKKVSKSFKFNFVMRVFHRKGKNHCTATRSTNWLVWMSSITTYSLLVMSSFTRYLKLTYSSFSHAMKLSLQRKFSLIRYFFLPSLLWISRCVRFLFTNCWWHGLLRLFWSVSVFETLSLYCLTSIQSPVETFLASSFYFAVY